MQMRLTNNKSEHDEPVEIFPVEIFPVKPLQILHIEMLYVIAESNSNKDCMNRLHEL